jgi:hypothetical protein
MREIIAPRPPFPFVLSLSKDCSFFWRLGGTHEEQGQCFDKLSTNGLGGVGFA